MKIALVCSAGGHLTELQSLSEASEGHESFYITTDDFRTRELDESKYLIGRIGTNPWQMLKSFFEIGWILVREQPDVLISTGSEIAIPAFFWAKIIGSKTIYIESWCRVNSVSTTGKIVYPVSDLFLVQWPELVDKVGEKARYEGAVI
ncbi:PssD/Cps14F family polysaccharide biosynthesis glycosyltransferase (plasmid) [Haloarcula sp. NS06]|uniref:PssD/Cps14F family polysaccharide biosynthesis glycosyltransferase n=1 Tax=Haloarcula sp. NS06 TaxID=3409688 RepID=UPI003DA7591C